MHLADRVDTSPALSRFHARRRVRSRKGGGSWLAPGTSFTCVIGIDAVTHRFRVELITFVINRIEIGLVLQSGVKTFLPGFGNGLLKKYAIVLFSGDERSILRLILGT